MYKFKDVWITEFKTDIEKPELQSDQISTN